jgi:hypothetical protein
MNTNPTSNDTDNKLLTLGIASFFLYPFTAIPGILIGRRQASMSSRGRVGYRLCWVCMGLFCLHILVVLSLLKQGLSHHAR